MDTYFSFTVRPITFEFELQLNSVLQKSFKLNNLIQQLE